jgi:polycystin 2
VVFIEFTVYNANLNLHTMVIILGEFPASGGLIPGYSFRTEKLFLYTTTSDFVMLAVEFVFILMLLYYIYEEIIEIISEKWKYLTQGWNYVDWANIIVSAFILC